MSVLTYHIRYSVEVPFWSTFILLRPRSAYWIWLTVISFHIYTFLKCKKSTNSIICLDPVISAAGTVLLVEQTPTRVGIWLTKTALQFISLLDIQFFSDTTPFRLKYFVHLRTSRKGLLIVCWGVYPENLVSNFLRKAHKYLPVDRHIPTQLNLQHRCKKLKPLSLYPIL